MSDKTGSAAASVSVLANGPFDRSFKTLAQENPRTAARILSAIEAATSSTPMAASVLSHSDDGTIAALKVEGYIVSLFYSAKRREVVVLDISRDSRNASEILDRATKIMLSQQAEPDSLSN